MKKLFAVLLGAAIVASAFAGGGAQVPASGGSAPAKQSITHWYWADNPQYSQLMKDMAADFNATNGKGYEVTVEEYPWDGGGYSNTLLTAAMGGGGPDTAAWKLTATPSFVANKLLADLDPFVNAWADKPQIEQSLWNVMRSASASVPGATGLYVMPFNTQVLYIYYRPSYFKQAGIDVPKSYDELLTAIQKCTGTFKDKDGKDIKVYGWGMRGSNGGQEPWGTFVYGAGGNFQDMTSAASVQGMQDFIDIYKKGYAPPSAPNDGFAQIIANFKNGTTAMTIHHTGSAKEMEALFGDDVSAFAPPPGKGRWTSMGDTDNVMFEKCKNKDAAFAWLAYLATGKGQETWNVTTFNVPVAAKVKAEAVFQNNRFMKASIDGSPFAGIIPINSNTSEWIAPTWPQTIQGALTGNQTAQQTMDTLQKALYK
jgi:multiple sugar transport system substrate-binding protein